jgi:hypothetical protein
MTTTAQRWYIHTYIYHTTNYWNLTNNVEQSMQCNKASPYAFIAGQTKLFNTVHMFLYMKCLCQQKHQGLTSSTSRILIFTITTKPALSPSQVLSSVQFSYILTMATHFQLAVG